MKNMLKEKEQLFKHISETTSVRKLEVTIGMVLFGMVMDEEHKDEYREIFDWSNDRLKTLSIINGVESPLMDIDIDKDWKKVEMSVMMSLMKSMVDSGKSKERMMEDLLGDIGMN